MTENIALYMRLSSEDAHAGESLSIGNQRSLLRDYVSSHREFDGCSILEFCDDGYSGAGFARPGIQKLLSLAGKTVNCIIVKDFSRFGRNLIEVGDYLDRVFPFLGVRFISVNDGYDSRQAQGSSVSLDVSIKALVHEMYCRDLSEKIRCVQQAKMRDGEYLCALAFYGYKRSETVKNHLEPDMPAAENVRRIFHMAADGMVPDEIAAALNREGVPSPLMYRRLNHTDGMRGWNVAGDVSYWTRENVRRIISDERYTGCLVSHKRTKSGITTARTEPVPKEEWITAKNTHEAVVPKTLFLQAQSVLKHRKPGTEWKKPGSPHQKFRGLLKCACCGRTLRRRECRQTYFICPAAKTGPGRACADVRLEERELEKKLAASIRTEVQNRKDCAAESGVDERKRLEDEIKKCQLETARYSTMLAAMFEDYAEGRISRDQYLSDKSDAAARQEETAARLSELSEQLAGMPQERQAAIDAGVGKHEQTGSFTRELLLELVKEIRVSGTDTIEIQWRENR